MSGVKFAGNVTIPASVENIGSRAFYTSKITSIIWNTSAFIPSECFQGCPLSKFVFGKDVSITGIGANAFSGCSSLLGIYQYDSNNAEIIKSDWTSLTSIGSNAFYNCSKLTGTIYLNQNCNYDEETTFYNCKLDRKIYRGV